MNPTYDFSGQVALVTGGTSGMGLATAWAFAKAGVAMIPHHSGAILMCREADLRDAELVVLCQEIITAQRSEIEQMEAIRARIDQAA